MTPKPNRRIPFQHLDARAWQNLGIAALLTLYLIQIIVEIKRPFWFFGTDFLGYWSAGYIANHWAFSKIYDLTTLQNIQSLILSKHYVPVVFTNPVWVPYLPIFIAIFQAFAILPPTTSLFVWDILNLTLIIGYLLFLSKSFARTNNKRGILLLVISFQVFRTLFEGQSSILLLIFTGEFTRNLSARKPFLAGLWLSMLSLKPQTLIVIIPALLLAKQWKVLLSTAIGATALALGSVWIAGKNGILAFLQLWKEFASHSGDGGIQFMANWRMVGIYLETICPAKVVTPLVFTLSLLTILWTLYLWKTHANVPLELLMMLVFSATLLATWHSHSHMSVILLPFILCLYTKGEFPKNLLHLWVFLPPLMYIISLGALAIHPSELLSGFLYGSPQFILNLITFIWTSKKILNTETP